MSIAKKQINNIKSLSMPKSDPLFGYILKYYIMKRFLSKNKKVPAKLIAEIKEAKEQIDQKYLVNLKDIVTENQKNKDLIKQSKELYKEYCCGEKYLGDTKIKDTMIINSGGEIGKNILKDFPDFISQKQKAICFTYIHGIDEMSWLDPKPFDDQMKKFRKFIKDGTLIIRECNNKERSINNKEWYCLVVQYKDEDENQACVGSLKLFDILFHGLVYWFANKTNRDNIYNWLTK